MSQDQLVESLLDEAFAAHETGDFNIVERRARAAFQISPENYEAISLLGLVALHREDFSSARDWFSRAVAIQEGESEAHTNLGLAYVALGRHEDALHAFDRALAIDSESGAAHFGQGVALHSLQELEPAEAAFRRATLRQPQHTESYLRHANVLSELERWEEAIPRYENALRLGPDHSPALVGHANACMQLERYEQALAMYDRALAIDPCQVEVLSNKGSALIHLGRLPEALDMFKQGLAISSDHPALMSNVCTALHEALLHEEALVWADRAVTIDPLLAAAHLSRGNVLIDLARLEEATESLSRAAALDPSDGEARYSLGWTRLLAGDWNVGLELLEARRRKRSKRPVRSFTVPRWRGDFELAGRTILLHADQGLGDTIMCCRYVPLVQGRGARVVVQVQRALKALIEASFANAEVIAMEEDGGFDCHCPLMSLPSAFRTTPDSIPSPSRYLAAPPERLWALDRRLGRSTRLRVGLAWSGNPSHTDDRLRSMSLSTFISALPEGADYYCLQKDIRDSDRSMLGLTPHIAYVEDVLGTFEDTAALIERMDLVIAVDTSIAHLAAALGRSTWILVPKRPDWRWMLEKRDTPWYSSARLFRQTDWQDWTHPLNEVRNELASKLRTPIP